MKHDRAPASSPRSGAAQRVKDFIERAREHHARTGEWPPDPLLDEVDEMRRRARAEHAEDEQKVP